MFCVTMAIFCDASVNSMINLYFKCHNSVISIQFEYVYDINTCYVYNLQN
jgi:hypothetical protein